MNLDRSSKRKSISSSHLLSRHALQRKCSCGNHTQGQGSCGSCGGDLKEKQIQKKLNLGSENDPLEREADRVANEVTSHSAGITNSIGGQRMPGQGIQKAGQTVSSVTDPMIPTKSIGSGVPLAQNQRDYYESRMGYDFSHVRLHTNKTANHAAQSVNARAYTQGNHIVFNTKQYNPSSNSGRQLLAHELTHVVQQTSRSSHAGETTTNRKIQRDRLECTSRRTVKVSAVSLPGSTGSISTDIANANPILCQCGIELQAVGGQSWNTNLLDLDAPNGVLNAPSGTVRALTREENTMLAHKPAGDDVIHVYYVPSFTGPKLAEAFWPAQHGESAVAVSNAAIPIVFPHEIMHVLLNDGSHHANRDNLMASGGVNSGAGELEEAQCART
ncbi:eCIS core domain-containing protein [Aliikangiella sp. IMCC44359]|uniref:eCIS core domain-containing protein n=1 Tax=Aliikangiella sp. IMCC44359 TaxID=3459125 RepID=UPI00403AEFD5